jgi:hypothetical protein
MVNNVLFNEDAVIQITYLCLNRLTKPEGNNDGTVDLRRFFGECRIPTSDVREFAEVLSEITMGLKSQRREPSGRSWVCCGDN